MNLEDRIRSFAKLGNYLSAIDEGTLDTLAQKAQNENAWFIKDSVRKALEGVKHYLGEDRLRNWLTAYDLTKVSPKTVAVVMAGNIPLVGFHDFLSVLIAGHRLQVKPSSKDSVLPAFVMSRLIEIEPRFGQMIQLTDRLRDFDAVIATGSDNSSRYFDYYFSRYPHVIRKNRTSCAVLSGFETPDELTALGDDVFSYFGLGCRNVSKVFLPSGYDPQQLIKAWEPYKNVMMHHKYHNNYDYQKSIVLINRVPFVDSEFVLLQESTRLVSPISVVYYEFYPDWNSLKDLLRRDENKIQCVVGNVPSATAKIGTAQCPDLSDYADRVDIMKFLTNLN